jgi:hypothetical protein
MGAHDRPKQSSCVKALMLADAQRAVAEFPPARSTNTTLPYLVYRKESSATALSTFTQMVSMLPGAKVTIT